MWIHITVSESKLDSFTATGLLTGYLIDLLEMALKHYGS